MVSLNDGALRTAELFERLQWARAMGLTFNGRRNLYEALGYKKPGELTLADYRERYERDGIAARVVEALAKATWRGGVELIEDEDPETETAFEKSWCDQAAKHDIIPKLEALDVLSGLSTFAVMVIGAPGEPNTELPKARKPEDLLYLQAYVGDGGNDNNRVVTNTSPEMSMASATIMEYVTDSQDERFGLPLKYQVRHAIPGAKAANIEVHYTRVIHAAEGCLDNDVFGQPKLRRVWNLFDDLEKVRGGGSEAFFQRANQGRVWNIDKDIVSLSQSEKDSMTEQIRDFQHNQIRDVKTRGVSVETLGSDVADFSSPSDAIITQIAGATSIPKRILTGSEMGELASSQDRDNWRDQVNGRREQYAFPKLLKKLVDRLIEYGYLVAPAETETDDDAYKAQWGAVMNLTEEEKRSGAAAWALAKTEEGPTFLNSEIRDHWYEMPPIDPEQLASLQKVREDKAKAMSFAKVPPGTPTGPNGQPMPGAPAAAKPAPVARAAEGLDDELIRLLEEAIDAKNIEVIHAILNL